MNNIPREHGEEPARNLHTSDDPEPRILQEEVESSIKKLSDGKAPGFEAISAKEIKISCWRVRNSSIYYVIKLGKPKQI